LKQALFVVLLIASLAPSDGIGSTQQEAAQKQRPGWLLPDYQFEKAGGVVVDSVGGRIWKEGGPEILYELSATSREKARVFALEHPRASLSVISSPTTGEIVAALDEHEGAMVVSVDRRAHFIVRNVRSRRDAVEVMLIATAGAGYTK
jgi:hypothetical protein